jgi:S-adenosylmethionine synthetase
MAANVGKKIFTATIKVVITANTKLSGHVEADEVAKMIRKETGYSAMVYEFVENPVEVTPVKQNKR